MDLSFLRDIAFAQTELIFEAIGGPVKLPPFPGSALRGAFGNAFRRGLCAKLPVCAQACLQPETCSYYLVFERERSARTGANVAKPYILDPPVPLTLEQIAGGAKVVPPYVLHPSPGLPAIENANP